MIDTTWLFNGTIWSFILVGGFVALMAYMTNSPHVSLTAGVGLAGFLSYEGYIHTWIFWVMVVLFSLMAGLHIAKGLFISEGSSGGGTYPS